MMGRGKVYQKIRSTAFFVFQNFNKMENTKLPIMKKLYWKFDAKSLVTDGETCKLIMKVVYYISICNGRVRVAE